MKLIWQNYTPYSTKFKDIYFDIKNGLEESYYVFIKGNNLEERWNANCFNANYYNNKNYLKTTVAAAATHELQDSKNVGVPTFNADTNAIHDLQNSKNVGVPTFNADTNAIHELQDSKNVGVPTFNADTNAIHELQDSKNVGVPTFNADAAAFCNNETFNIAELGFGSGLNFSLTSKIFLEQNNKYKKLNFYSCEKFPLSTNDIIKIKNNFESLDKYYISWLQTYNENLIKFNIINKPETYNENLNKINIFHKFCIFNNFNILILFNVLKKFFSNLFYNLFFVKNFIKVNLYDKKVFLNLFFGDVKDFLHLLRKNKIKIDAWYMDGFSPKSNPEMWSEKVCKKMYSVSNQNATLATFSSAGVVKRALLKSNWKIRKQKGFNKKREMITGIR